MFFPEKSAHLPSIIAIAMDIINPATEEIIATLDADSPEIVREAWLSARSGQRVWQKRPLAERIEVLGRFSTLLQTHEEELARILSEEMGKPIWQARNELRGARQRIQFFLKESPVWLSSETMFDSGGLVERIGYEPLGVVVNISAWNYPYLVGVNVIIPALIAGNAVLYKPSEYATLTGLRIEALMYEAGVPADVFIALTGGPEVGQALLELDADGYFFTGSYKTGRSIYEKVAHKMVPCQMELGGKDPLYVSADNGRIGLVAQAAAEGVLYNAGQSCCAVERIYVHESHYQAFVEAFVEEVKQWKLGDPLDESTKVGPLSRKQQVNYLQQMAGDAVLKGGNVVYGAERYQGKGYFFIPTVVADAHHGMRLMREESFGPLIGIQPVRSDREAIELMQDTEYGLTAAVYSDHYESAAPILEEMHTGSVYWNCCDRVSPRLPWSGRQHSGIGATLSYHGIRAFVRPKAYHLRGKS